MTEIKGSRKQKDPTKAQQLDMTLTLVDKLNEQTSYLKAQRLIISKLKKSLYLVGGFTFLVSIFTMYLLIK